MNLVGIDCHILIWGVQKTARPGQEQMILRSITLLDKLDQEKAKVMVSSVAVGEFLVKLSPIEQDAVKEILGKRFLIAPYDLAAAVCAARIRQSIDVPELRAEFPDLSRKDISADCQILATAVTRRVCKLYTHDEPLIKMAKAAKLSIDVCNMPTDLAQQMALAMDAEPVAP